jgi:hypothetical protein
MNGRSGAHTSAGSPQVRSRRDRWKSRGLAMHCDGRRTCRPMSLRPSKPRPVPPERDASRTWRLPRGAVAPFFTAMPTHRPEARVRCSLGAVALICRCSGRSGPSCFRRTRSCVRAGRRGNNHLAVVHRCNRARRAPAVGRSARRTTHRPKCSVTSPRPWLEPPEKDSSEPAPLTTRVAPDSSNSHLS